MAHPITIVIPIYNGVTHLDFTGPHQFLSRLPDAKVIVASMGGKDVGADGLVFSGLADLSTIERCDVLCVPGGSGCTRALQDEAFVLAIRHLGLSAQYITSVCTGSLILGAAGLLKGKRVACHWAWRDMLLPFGAIPNTDRVVRDGNILTGGGVTAGIDFVLTLIAELQGDEVAQRIQLMLEYAPAPPFNSGRPETASQKTVDAVRSWMQPFVQQRHDEIALAAARLAE
ncbi:DJ-1/PfpI family protein [Phyllobacterium sp. OV277]|uniref:DJ-1/PfpI family protein n=1 Tax=Phyllobacterium sp. OV277 TaxID=1882772 RepID=UPI000881EB5C|nr:DJ-1/PfpI family protein [Phyllobacterium sp. OV277]SDN81279.1 Transcriptional regulator GlxA family, contains an amidase domain and an AraC-type DNA-binding HTH domain [Phyllobacterium sp. OV277]